MYKSIKDIAKKSFKLIGLEVSDSKAYKEMLAKQVNLNELEYAFERLNFIASKFNRPIKTWPDTSQFFVQSIDKLVYSKAQLFQDLFVLYCLKNKRNGFFVEFGATNGVNLSNTYLLEKEYAWEGILAEPARVWNAQLRKNRSCFIEDKCVWIKSNSVLVFDEVSNPEFSTITNYSDNDFNASARVEKNTYEVQTISLNDLLKKHNAPFEIDYLSVDTEGSEYEILNAFDFSKYNIKIITVEHNYTKERENIYDLLVQNGYERVFEEISLFDDWYILKDIISKRIHQ